MPLPLRQSGLSAPDSNINLTLKCNPTCPTSQDPDCRREGLDLLARAGAIRLSFAFAGLALPYSYDINSYDVYLCHHMAIVSPPRAVEAAAVMSMSETSRAHH